MPEEYYSGNLADPGRRQTAARHSLHFDAINSSPRSMPRLVLPLDVAFEIVAVEVDVPEVARSVALGLVVEVGR